MAGGERDRLLADDELDYHGTIAEALDLIRDIQLTMAEYPDDAPALFCLDFDAIRQVLLKLGRSEPEGRITEGTTSVEIFYGGSAALATSFLDLMLHWIAGEMAPGLTTVGDILAPSLTVLAGFMGSCYIRNTDLLTHIFEELAEYDNYLTNRLANPAYDPGPHFRKHPGLTRLRLLTLSHDFTKCCTAPFFEHAEADAGLPVAGAAAPADPAFLQVVRHGQPIARPGRGRCHTWPPSTAGDAAVPVARRIAPAPEGP